MNGAAGLDADARDVVEAAGHFRIYLGAAAGVGKTCAMLGEAHRRAGRGSDVAVAFVECHGRRVTQNMADGLEVIPRKTVSYRDRNMQEMDLDAVLARRPEVALVDELAHTNVPGAGRNEKRWQDVLELLSAGIDVITTVNIQHLESIADAVERMTRAPVRERVPDWVVRRANQIELVDSSPEQLRRRMMHGNIYPAERAAQALENFFCTDNLIALRELTLRFLADETDEELLARLRQHQPNVVWETTERILVAVTATKSSRDLLHRAARVAARVRAALDVVYVTAGDSATESDRGMIAQLRELAGSLGAHWHEIEDEDPVRAIAQFARQHQITQIVIGASSRRRWHNHMGASSKVARLIDKAGDFGIDVHVIASREQAAPESHSSAGPSRDLSSPDGTELWAAATSGR